MADPITFGLKTIWDEWNIRVCVLLSLFLQVFLTLFASFRKRTANKIVNLLIWLAYLLADSTAIFALGLIANVQESPTPFASKDLLVFWGPFLLLHLGGPDSITAFSLEDNELWPRHLLQLTVQIAVTVYVFSSTLPNKVTNPSIFIFLDGIIKYLERTCSLYLASSDKIRASNAPAMEERQIQGKLRDVEVVKEAHALYMQFNGVIVDRKFKFSNFTGSRAFFNSIDAKDAFRVIETELNFMYEVLFTKAALVHSKLGYLFRLTSFTSAVSALATFHFNVKKQGFHEFDVRVTYALLFGAVLLDIISLFMAIFSDWTVVNTLQFLWAGPLLSKFNKSILFRKWSGFVSGRSLRMRNFMNLGYVMKNYCHFLSFKGYVKGGIYLSIESLDEDYWEFVFTEMKIRSQWADNSKKAELIFSGNSKWLRTTIPELGTIIDGLCLNEIAYDESILLWHVVTEHFYSDLASIHHDYGKERKFSKILSYYMFYLLLDESSIIADASGICKLRFSDNFTDTLNQLRNEFFRPVGRLYLKYFDKSPYVSHLPSLSSALISTLNQMEKGLRWKIMSKMWVELLAYAASHCKGNIHAQQLSKGGELVTIVWLLLNHLGLGGLQD
ncbi:uncharacterized protein LOC126664944 [Mercurialis annua]|uniref:uncharacterized protein LOC126664944 n=1 Tax=Mercurialis annua TaxID=3986 RepID=UPI002160371B|nr:uncharacterized protein LOC126664944 [Mercurialis annua]